MNTLADLIVNARRRKVFLYVILAGLVGFVVHDQVTRRVASDLTVTAASNTPGDRSIGERSAVVLQGPEPSLSTERATLGVPRAELFAPHTWQPPARETTAAPPAPVAPAIPYRFAGTLLEGRVWQILLSRGDAVFPVKAGDILDGTYVVESIAEDEIVFVYLPLQTRQRLPIDPTIAVAGTAAGAQPDPSVETAPRKAQTALMVEQTATLEWVGPKQVRIGEAFDVGLRVSSNQPVQAAPIQLRFDPKVLESVAIRPGRMFGAAPPKFTYRINPDGTIVVGAAATGPIRATDDELMVFTFKAVAPASEASLALTTTGLLDSGGHTIVVGRIETYRTVILR